MTKIIIFGATGFVGKAIHAKLLGSSKEIIKIDRNKFFELTTSPLKFRNIIGESDIIVFAAAKAPSKTNVDFLENMFLVQEFVNLVNGTPFSYLLNISSDAVYGDYLRPILENDFPQPGSLHGIMHYSRELLLNYYFGDRMGNLRPTLIYGPEDTHSGYGPNRFIKQALMNKPIEIFGNGEEQRDHIFIDDLAVIAEQMINLSYRGNLNAATGQTIDFKSIAIYVQEIIPMSKIIYKDRDQKNLPHNGYRAFDISNLTKIVPNIKFHNMKDGIKNTITWSNKYGI